MSGLETRTVETPFLLRSAVGHDHNSLECCRLTMPYWLGLKR